MAQKKMGRPLIGDSPLTDRIFIRVSNETKTMLDACTKARNISRSDVVREGIKKVYDDLEN